MSRFDSKNTPSYYALPFLGMQVDQEYIRYSVAGSSRMMNYLYQNIIIPFRTDRKSSVSFFGNFILFSFDFAHAIRGSVPAINRLRFRVEDTVHTTSALV